MLKTEAAEAKYDTKQLCLSTSKWNKKYWDVEEAEDGWTPVEMKKKTFERSLLKGIGNVTIHFSFCCNS